MRTNRKRAKVEAKTSGSTDNSKKLLGIFGTQHGELRMALTE